jgi:hypothetical protein
MVGLLVCRRPGQVLSDDAAEGQQRPLAIGLGKGLPESCQRETLERLRWARGGRSGLGGVA